MVRIRNRDWTLRNITRTEWLVIATIVVILVALLLPRPRWASSGTEQAPVRIFVFDVANARPIPDAQVALLYGPLPQAGVDIVAIRDRVPDDLLQRVPSESFGLTGDDGVAVMDFEFDAGANYERPERHVHVQRAWVVVVAERYGTVVVPVRHDSMPTRQIREQDGLFVPIGMAPTDSGQPGLSVLQQ